MENKRLWLLERLEAVNSMYLQAGSETFSCCIFMICLNNAWKIDEVIAKEMPNLEEHTARGTGYQRATATAEGRREAAWFLCLGDGAAQFFIHGLSEGNKENA